MAAVRSVRPSAERPLQLRMRGDLECVAQRYRGRRCWCIKDPVALKYIHLRDEEFTILSMLDGVATADAVRRQFERSYAPARLNFEQLQRFIGRLNDEGLLVVEGGDQAATAHERRQKKRRAKHLAAMANLLAIRFPGIDADRFLEWLNRRIGWMFSRTTASVGLVVAAVAIAIAVLHRTAIVAEAPAWEALATPRVLIGFAAALAFVKILHELGHGVACKRFGGECHELGVMLLVFTPCLYCNVSDMWVTPDKWKRTAVSFAGVYVELWLAALATLLWWASEPGLFHALCLNVMLICSLSTLLINGNPLLRYDGYYVLSDMIEIPNLGPRAAQSVERLAARWLLGQSDDAEPWTQSHDWFLLVYGLASVAYRAILLCAILWFLHRAARPHGLEALITILAVLVVGQWTVGATAPLARRLSRPGVPLRPAKTRMSVLAILAAVSLLAACLVPLPRWVSAPAILDFVDAADVYVSAGGTLVETVSPGVVVRPGDVVARLQNLDLDLEVVRLEGEVERARARLKGHEAQRGGDAAARDAIPTARAALADAEDRLAERRRDQERLTLRAPRDGIVLSPPERQLATSADALGGWCGTPLAGENLGCCVEPGALLCRIGSLAQSDALVYVNEADIAAVRAGQRAAIQFDAYPGRRFAGLVREAAEIDVDQTPPELLSSGVLASVAAADGSLRPLGAVYRVRVAMTDLPVEPLPGAVGRAKIEAEREALAARLFRTLASVFRISR